VIWSTRFVDVRDDGADRVGDEFNPINIGFLLVSERMFVYHKDMLAPALDLSEMCESEIRERYIETRREIDRAEAFAARLLLAARKACETLPLMAKAWSQGEISASAAATIALGRRENHEAVYASMEDDLVRRAATSDFRGLDARIRYYQLRCDELDDTAPVQRNDLALTPAQIGERCASRRSPGSSPTPKATPSTSAPPSTGPHADSEEPSSSETTATADIPAATAPTAKCIT
jgi:hypothetical protein